MTPAKVMKAYADSGYSRTGGDGFRVSDRGYSGDDVLTKISVMMKSSEMREWMEHMIAKYGGETRLIDVLDAVREDESINNG